MVFSSMTFTYIFLPIVLLVHFLCPKEHRNLILLMFSFLFYMWGGPGFFYVIILTIILNYIGALLIDKYQRQKIIFLSLTVLSNLALLFHFKYHNFFISSINSLFGTDFKMPMTIFVIGISFYTFQAISYIVDVYRGECKVQKNIIKLALYISFFPQLIAGPIIKYHDIEGQIDSREADFDKFVLGVKRFIIGLSKKILIADTLGCIVDKIFMQDPHLFSHATAWLGSIAYVFQIYFDFSGYSDMAIGLGLMFGFRFMENFNYPYISKSCTEFWRRWHISLSTWFKQYVYIPLGGNRNGKVIQIRNLGFVFLLTGLWHGASWTFVLWGIWHGFFIIIEKILNVNDNTEQKYLNFFKHIYLLLIVTLGFVIFRAENVVYAKNYIMNMMGLLSPDSSAFIFGMSYYVDTVEVIVLSAAILCSVPIFRDLIYKKNPWQKAIVNVLLLLLFFLSTLKMAGETYNPFIYFQF